MGGSEPAPGLAGRPHHALSSRGERVREAWPPRPPLLLCPSRTRSGWGSDPRLTGIANLQRSLLTWGLILRGAQANKFENCCGQPRRQPQPPGHAEEAGRSSQRFSNSLDLEPFLMEKLLS